MTTKDLAQYIGQERLYTTTMLCFRVVVEDAKVIYGSVVLQIRPVAGHGSMWVQMTRTRSIAEAVEERLTS